MLNDCGLTDAEGEEGGGGNSACDNSGGMRPSTVRSVEGQGLQIGERSLVLLKREEEKWGVQRNASDVGNGNGFGIWGLVEV